MVVVKSIVVFNSVPGILIVIAFPESFTDDSGSTFETLISSTA
jgi:hypothetical protein